MIPIAVCTVARPQPYLYATMTSLLASDWQGSDGQIHLSVGGADCVYAQAHAGQRVSVHPLTADEWETMRHTCVHARFNANYRRCLQRAGDDGLIVLEDDVLVRPDWLRCRRLAIPSLDLRRPIHHRSRCKPLQIAARQGCCLRCVVLLLPHDELVGIMNDLKMPIETLNKRLDRWLARVAEGVRSAKDENATPTVVIED